jgi:endonuclease/exonuclease/phosphatase family metal-dependent hydrolase
LKLATFNLFQLVAPGFYWYERSERNTYTPAEWAQKHTWITTRLQQMDADVIGFQEVFSAHELQSLCAAAGYPHFVTVDEAGCKPDDAGVYIKSVVALASRFPIITIHPVDIPMNLRTDLPIPEGFRFSRSPICAEIQTPDLGTVIVYVLHLKSKRPVSLDMHYDDCVAWDFRVRDTLQRLSRGTISSFLQRGIEATLLYHHVTNALQEGNGRPIIVLGDMNDGLDSAPLAALTMQERIYSIGGLSSEQWPAATMQQLHSYRLADTFRLSPNMRQRVRPFTIIHHGVGGVLDYILVSNTLNPKNAAALAEVVDYRVWNQHLDEDGVENRLQSDHGQVCVELRPCAAQPDYVTTLSHSTRPLNTLADILTRQDFVEYAGGVFQSPKHFKQSDSDAKWKHFWSFFFDTEYGWVTSIYGSTPVNELYQKQHHSIEHVIPREFLDRYLARKGVPRYVRYGATVNPFNFMPSERGLNAKRSNFPFDMDDDQIVRPQHLQLHTESFDSTGFDADNEWVIPSRNRGDIARAILYMLLVYEIDELYNQHIDTLIHWAKVDSPSAWELAYNNWVHTRLGIRNPFIDNPEKVLALFNNHTLMHAIEFRQF